MNNTLKSIGARLNNAGTLMALAGLFVSLLLQFGLDIDSDRVLGIVQTLCAILITLGVLNDPTQNKTPYIPGVKDKLIESKK